jgi:hypothetical protein
MAGIDLKNERDFDVMLKTMAQIVEWAFQAAKK